MTNNYCGYNTQFKNVDNITEDFLLNILESNFKIFLDWSFLNVGAWFDAQVNQSGFYGGNTHSSLVLSDDPSYDDGAVWQSIRKDWVWETGVTYNSTSPVNVSGLYINNTFVPYSGNTYSVDYPEGRIIFNSGIATNSKVKLNYSYRYIQVHRSIDSPWFDVLQYNTYKTNNLDITKTDSGDWSIAGNARIQMPAIIIEAIPRSRSRPYEIGNNNLLIEQDLGFHILAENKNDRNKLMDILRLQQDNTIMLFDTNSLSQNDNFPLTYLGDKKNNPKMYPNIVNDYPWRHCLIKTVNLFDIDSPHPNLHRGMVKMTTEIISE